jgi:hypothetical protein
MNFRYFVEHVDEYAIIVYFSEIEADMVRNRHIKGR